MAVIFSGKMRFVTLIPNGFYKQEDKEVKMFNVILQDKETNELHEFGITEAKKELLDSCMDFNPMEEIQVIMELQYDKWAIKKGNKPSKFVLRELYPVQPISPKK